jgi:hypothetical protein
LEDHARDVREEFEERIQGERDSGKTQLELEDEVNQWKMLILHILAERGGSASFREIREW